MVVKVLFHRGIEKDLKKLPKNIKERFLRSVRLIEESPLSGIPLKGEFAGSRKIRLGDYRIVYQFSPKKKTAIVYRIESRQGVYKK